MRRQRSLSLVLFLSAVFVVFGCGGSQTAREDEPETPTISATVAVGDSDVELGTDAGRLPGAPDGLVIGAEFNTEMDADTINSDNVTMECEGDEYDLSIEKVSDTEWTIAPEDSLIGYADCSLTFGAGIKSADGLNLEETVIPFNTECSKRDDFTIDTFGDDPVAGTLTITGLGTFDTSTGYCWTYLDGENNDLNPFYISNGKLTYLPGDYGWTIAATMVKEFNVTPDDLVVTARISASEVGSDRGGCSVYLLDQERHGAFLSLSVLDGENTCLTYKMLQGNATPLETAPCNVPSVLRIVKNNNSFTAYYGGDEDSLHSLGSTTLLTSGSSFGAGIGCASDADDGTDVSIDWIEMSEPPDSPSENY